MTPNLLSIVIIFSMSLGIPAMVFQSWNEVPADCKKFFLNGIPPIFKDPGPHVKIICQKYENRFHFVTLYDTGNRSAIYSAYNVDPGPERPDESWKVELGALGDQNNPCKLGDDMDTAGWLNSQDRSCLPLFQAINQDYTGNGFDKGHLNPVQLQNKNVIKEATFTLTNAVPQSSGFNRGEWKSGETELREIAEDCRNRQGVSFAVTGAITGPDFIGCGEDCGSWTPPSWSDPNKRVNIPTITWSASLCRMEGRDNVTYYEPFVFWGENKDDSTLHKEDTWEGLHKFEKDILQPHAPAGVTVKIFRHNSQSRSLTHLCNRKRNTCTLGNSGHPTRNSSPVMLVVILGVLHWVFH
uniref:endonuclease domain-containing 1 protein-like n=1 Tax=Myxine glutinosa TaxID=7769 RepID=UPI00358FA023